MPTSTLEQLRSGVLISSQYKLLERIPRWVSERRFRALETSSQKLCNLLFFHLNDKNFQTLSEWVSVLSNISHPSLYSISHIGKFQNFTYLVGQDLFAPSLQERVENEGTFPYDALQRFTSRLLEAIDFLSEYHFPLPALTPNVVLFLPDSFRPVLFPIPLPAFPPTPPDQAPLSLRDLIYFLATASTPPVSFDPSLLASFPPPTRQAFAYILKENPTLEDIRAFCSTHILPTPARPLPPILSTSTTSPPLRKSKSDTPDQFDKPSHTSERIRKRRPPEPNSLTAKINFAITLLTFLCVLLFFLAAANSLLIPLPPKPTPTHPSTQPLPTTAPTAPTAPITSPPLTPLWPTDAPGRPGSALPEWTRLYSASPSDPTLAANFERYLASLAIHEQALRSGLLPDALRALEQAHEAGFPPASYLLAKVLWGRETARSEAIMAAAARAGHRPAQQWCDELYINWRKP